MVKHLDYVLATASRCPQRLAPYPHSSAAAVAAAAAAAGDKLQLQGLCAFDAAVHCASMTTWPTSAGGSHNSKQISTKAHWLRGLLQRVLSRVDLLGASALQAA
jgi:hypothetical protein